MTGHIYFSLIIYILFLAHFTIVAILSAYEMVVGINPKSANHDGSRGHS